jgi:CelD/BcsL family acetyltransferase involved in cellulose biosynthesis
MRFIEDADDLDKAWDEINLTNIPRQQWSSLDVQRISTRLVSDVEHVTWIAPLDEALDQDSLFRRMSANRRSKIRRTFKEYEKQGSLCVDNATSTDEALDYFRSLGVLHTQRWNRVGKPGSFANPAWVAFHEDLIVNAFPRGEIQLLRIRCGPRAIGYLYNFLWRGDVLMLQSGFASESSNILRPGYVSHMLAMQFNAHRGAKRYDFLIGDSEYKEVLADRGTTLVTGRVQRNRIKFIVEDRLVRMYRRLRRSARSN